MKAIAVYLRTMQFIAHRAHIGTQNLLAGIADESEVRQYKLKQRTLP